MASLGIPACVQNYTESGVLRTDRWSVAWPIIMRDIVFRNMYLSAELGRVQRCSGWYASPTPSCLFQLLVASTITP
jgi:hypothetical protein